MFRVWAAGVCVVTSHPFHPHNEILATYLLILLKLLVPNWHCLPVSASLTTVPPCFCAALNVLRAAVDPQQFVLKDWRANKSFCNWPYVHCDKAGNVVRSAGDHVISHASHYIRSHASHYIRTHASHCCYRNHTTPHHGFPQDVSRHWQAWSGKLAWGFVLRFGLELWIVLVCINTGRTPKGGCTSYLLPGALFNKPHCSFLIPAVMSNWMLSNRRYTLITACPCPSVPMFRRLFYPIGGTA